jgi:hypothetical protein
MADNFLVSEAQLALEEVCYLSLYRSKLVHKRQKGEKGKVEKNKDTWLSYPTFWKGP